MALALRATCGCAKVLSCTLVNPRHLRIKIPMSRPINNPGPFGSGLFIGGGGGIVLEAIPSLDPSGACGSTNRSGRLVNPGHLRIKNTGVSVNKKPHHLSMAGLFIGGGGGI